MYGRRFGRGRSGGLYDAAPSFTRLSQLNPAVGYGNIFSSQNGAELPKADRRARPEHGNNIAFRGGLIIV